MQALQKAPQRGKRRHEAAAHRRVAHTVIQEKQIHVMKVPFRTLQRAASFHALLIRAHQWKWVVPLNPTLPQQPLAPYHPGLLLYLLTAYDKKDGNLDRQVLKCTSREYKLCFLFFPNELSMWPFSAETREAEEHLKQMEGLCGNI